MPRSIYAWTGERSVKLEPRSTEDMWHVYNLVAPGDSLPASKIRKVQQELSPCSSTSDRVRIILSIDVKSAHYDSTTTAMRVRGCTITENPHVKGGSFHIIKLELNRAFALAMLNWDLLYIDRPNLATNPTTDTDLMVAIMREGLAQVLLVSRYLMVTRARMDTAIPQKGKNAICNRERSPNSLTPYCELCCIMWTWLR